MPNTNPKLTAEQIQAGWESTFSTNNPFCPCDLKSFTKAVNWAESAIAATAPNAGAPLVNAELREALEAARNGLQWYRDTYPEADSGADDEMMAQIEAALAAAPAQQAGAPLEALMDEFSAAHAAWNESPMENRPRERYRVAREALYAALKAADTGAPLPLAPSEPVAWVSPEQFDAHPDGGPDRSGRYLPMRKSMAGKFTMPFYTRAQPQADEAEPVAMTVEERQRLADTIDEFIDTGETLTEYAVLLDWAARGLLECAHFIPTEAGRVAAAQARGVGRDAT